MSLYGTVNGGPNTSTAITTPTFSSASNITNTTGQTITAYCQSAATTSLVITLDGVTVANLAALTTTGNNFAAIRVPNNSVIKVTSAGGSWVWAAD
jgi:hypothetical protein